MTAEDKDLARIMFGAAVNATLMQIRADGKVPEIESLAEIETYIERVKAAVCSRHSEFAAVLDG